MIVKENTCFDYFENDVNSKVIELIPDCFGDDRGYFMEVLRYDNKNTENLPTVLQNPKYIKQINRSSSSKSVFRGFHAQFGPHCQGKLVEVLTEKVYDIIVDARPNSKSFGISTVVLLDSKTHNKLWVPRGFLHGFIVPYSIKSNAIFEYMCDNTYEKSSEITIQPSSVLEKMLNNFKSINVNNHYDDLFYTVNNGDLTFSKKDLMGENYESFMNRILDEYVQNRKLWFK
jgi:dTDP-4-dehydrorhamnose 3,5-epimerase